MQRITGPNSAFLTGGKPGNALHASSPPPFPPFLLRFPLVLPDRNAYRLQVSRRIGSDHPLVRLEHARRIAEMPMRRFLSVAYRAITLLGEEPKICFEADLSRSSGINACQATISPFS
jgi:hypothetical protein